MQWATRLYAVASLASAALLAAMPWGLPGSHRMVGPLSVAALIVAIVSFDADAVPTWGVAAVGIVFDCLTLAPLGFWTLIWLAALASGCAAAGLGGGRLLRLTAATAAVAGVAAFYWALLSLYQWRLAEWQPIAWVALAIAVLLAPAMMLANWLGHGRTSPASLRLERSRP